MKHLIILLVSLTLSCGNDTSPINTNDPSNLDLNVLVYDDGSGIVAINAIADNATEYHFYMGDEEDNIPYISTNGSYEHTYTILGSYEIEIRAYGASGRYVKLNKRIFVPGGEPVSTGQGYTTPQSYDGLELVWNDEFNGTSLNENNWSYDNGTGCPNLCGWGNNELEYYKSENAWVADGVLTLEARKENFQGSDYTSSKIVTRDKQGFQYGRIDIRATLPEGQGIWPALWMLGTNQRTVGWPKCGEIDIMEMIGGDGRENKVSGNAFWDNNGVRDMPKGYILDNGLFSDEFHVFSIIWTDQSITWYVNDNAYHSLDITTADKTEFHNPFYIIFNVAVGGNWPGSPDATTVFPTQMRVDYIRVFQEL